MAERSFDVIVLGAGAPGEVAAGRLGAAGIDVAVVEEHLVGGTCAYYACMPSKALLRPGELLAEARRVPGLSADGLDAAAVLARRDEVIHGLDDSSQLPWLEERGVALVRGHATFDGEKRIRVGDDTLLARTAVVIATGSGPTMPPIPGLAESRPWGNREATTANEPPDSLVILGGGVVGVELAQAWASLGTKVVVLEGAPRVIVREEPFASAEVEAALREAGVDVRTHSRAASVARDGEVGDVTVTMEDGSTATGSEFLVAVGRTPTTANLGLETIGLEPGKPVEVGSNLRSPRHDWLYAIGDVNNRALLTHMGKYQARLAADAILGKDVRLVSDGPLSPRVIFTDPQVAAVGHTLTSAESAGMVVTAVDVETSGTAGASFIGRGTPGTSRLVVDDTRRVLVGATFVGVEVAEWLHAATIAVIAEVPLERLVHAVPSFPTRSEIWLKLLEAYGL